MDIQIKQGPQCHPSNCYTYRNDDILFIVIHFTGNNGDTALNNCNYFSGANRGASAHYFIGDDGIYQSVPDKWAREAVKWAVDNKIMQGDENGLNLDDKDLRYITMLYRMGNR